MHLWLRQDLVRREIRWNFIFKRQNINCTRLSLTTYNNTKFNHSVNMLIAQEYFMWIIFFWLPNQHCRQSIPSTFPIVELHPFHLNILLLATIIIITVNNTETKCHVHLVKESRKWLPRPPKKGSRFIHNEHCTFTYQNFGKRKLFSVFKPAIHSASISVIPLFMAFIVRLCRRRQTI